MSQTETSVAKPMTRQDVFDRVWQRFVVEKAPKSFEGNRCVYRTADGRCCFVGALIPDDVYTAKMEMQSAYGLWDDFVGVRSLFADGVTALFLRDLQIIHDGTQEFRFHEVIERKLRAFAVTHNLTIPA